MRANCGDLTEVTIPSGHWMAQEKPIEVNSALAKWLATKFPAAQWDYQLFYRENFAAARAGWEGDVRATVKALFSKSFILL